MRHMKLITAALTLVILTASQQSLGQATQPGFRILWHTGPLIWQMTRPENKPQIEELKEAVDGYYFLLTVNSQFHYWPDAPYPNDKCKFNFKLKVPPEPDPLEINCKLAHRAYIETKYNQGAPLTQEQYVLYSETNKNEVIAAFVENMAIMPTPKKIISEGLINNVYFEYDGSPPKLSIKKDRDGIPQIPHTMDNLQKRGVRIDLGMWYREPLAQEQSETYLVLPNDLLDPYGRYSPTLNQKLLNKLKVAVAAEENPNLPPQGLINVRRWDTNHENDLDGTPVRSPYLKGVLFEGGIRSQEEKEGQEFTNFEMNAKGANWLLRDRDTPPLHIYFMMPLHLTRAQMDTKYENDPIFRVNRDVLNFLRDLNAEIYENGGVSAKPICNPRVNFIPAGYGHYFHPDHFPLRDAATQHPAATVGGQVLTLRRFRDDFCSDGS